MISACFFGGEDRQLFGVYHEPDRPRDESVLLCYPFGHEYMRAHWAFRQLAETLSRAGYHVFRFDYFGTGDSAGEHARADIRDWLSDIALASKELAEISGARKTTVIGLRLGALLAAAAVSAKEISVKRLVLWDPILRGADYRRELAELDRRKLACPYYPRSELPEEARDEMFGFEASDTLRSQLDALDIFSLELTTARVTVLAGNDSPGSGTAMGLEGLGAEIVAIPNEGDWLDVPKSGQAIMPSRALREISRIMEVRG